jgi:uncharacterized protein YjbI with pentapeptide repeats
MAITPDSPRANSTSSADAKELLDAANDASEKISLLHIVFMAVCAYILLMVFSTTDLDLLVGKGVKLPLIDVEVPIVGFYIVAPFLVLLVHFNLLLQLQILSRKLYAYDNSANPLDTRIGGNTLPGMLEETTGERQSYVDPAPENKLDSFPYTYYLVSQTKSGMQWCLGAVVGLTILLLPLFTLLILQLRFLAYQHFGITWWQRIVVWSNVGIVLFLWPIIMNRDESWKKYFVQLKTDIRLCKIPSSICAILWSVWIIWLFLPVNLPTFLTICLALLSIASIVSFFMLRRRRQQWSGNKYCECFRLRGMLPYLLVLAIGMPMPLALMVKGGWFESIWGETGFSQSGIVNRFRTLQLTGQVIFPTNIPPEIVEQLRAGGTATKKALNKVVPIRLKERSLRGAKLTNAVLTGADLAGADLTEADLYRSHLAYANLDGANLNQANATEAHLEGANLTGVHLEKACFFQADLQGTFFSAANASFADFESANLKGADLSTSSLSGASFYHARLEGANFFNAKVDGANFFNAFLDRTDMRVLQKIDGAAMSSVSVCDLRRSKPLFSWKNEPVIIARAIPGKDISKVLQECFGSNVRKMDCRKTIGANEDESLVDNLYYPLKEYACESPAIARVLLLQNYDENSQRQGFPKFMTDNAASTICEAVNFLSPEDKSRLRHISDE